MNKRYSAKFFIFIMPDWKKKKDPLIAQVFYRPISFYLSSFCANRGISANSVSYFSMYVAILSCVCYFLHDHTCHIIGAFMVNIWLLLDCVDGNIARSVKSQPFGEFADAASSYLLISFIYISIGYAIYEEGGFFVSKGNVFILLLATFATVSDSFMRLLFHKYNAELSRVKGIYPKVEGSNLLNHTKSGEVPSFRERIGEALGIGGFLPVFILLFTFFRMADLIIYFVFLYNVLKSSIVVAFTISGAIRQTKLIEKNS